jgi:hypothetical protein
MNAFAAADVGLSPIDLSLFVDKSRKERAVPFGLGGGTAATNGRVLVWTPAPCATPTPESIGDQSRVIIEAARPLALDDAAAWVPAASITIGEVPCTQCKGSGRCEEIECDNCDGTGEFDHGRHIYDCQECDGEGRIVEPAEKASTAPACSECAGTGIHPDQPSDFRFSGKNGKKYCANSMYVQQLRSLPNCELLSGKMERGMIAIRFTGGCGILMPMFMPG